jgi:hypothetical protein
MLYCVSCDGADAYFVVEAVGRREANKMVYDAIATYSRAQENLAGGEHKDPLDVGTPPSFERVLNFYEKEKKKKRVSMLRLLTAEPLHVVWDDARDKIYDISIGDEAE